MLIREYRAEAQKSITFPAGFESIRRQIEFLLNPPKEVQLTIERHQIQVWSEKLPSGDPRKDFDLIPLEEIIWSKKDEPCQSTPEIPVQPENQTQSHLQMRLSSDHHFAQES